MTSAIDPLVPYAVAPLQRAAVVAGKDRIRCAARWVVRGPDGSAAWERPALFALLAMTAVLYLWGIGDAGWGNLPSAAAVQAGTQSWTAFLYGSADAANSITVGSPPAALWLMALFARCVGLSPAGLLLPQALVGVASVAVLYATVRRGFDARTAVLAGAAFALAPAAATVFRSTAADALLVLLLCLAVYFTVRGIETGALRWLLWAGVMVGFGFLTAGLHAFLVLPVLAGVYIFASPRMLRDRCWHLVGALCGVVVAAGWWVAIVELVPESWRPYIGGSRSNSFLEATFGDGAIGRLLGGVAAVTGAEIPWLLPVALLLGVIGLVLLGRTPRGDIRRAILLLGAGSLLVTTVAGTLAGETPAASTLVAQVPAAAAVFAIGASLLWQRRDAAWARATLAGILAGAGLWGWMTRAPSAVSLPWLATLVLGLSLVGALMLLLPRRSRALSTATVVLALSAVMLGPGVVSIQGVLGAPTLAASGTSAAAAPGVVALLQDHAARYTWPAATIGSDTAALYQLESGQPVMPVGGMTGSDPSPTLEKFIEYVGTGRVHYFIGGEDTSGSIAEWVAENYPAQTIDGVTLYNFSG